MLGHTSYLSNLEDYWKDDFTPLQDAGKDVLAALREDENASDADLFRRIAASDDGCHQYFPATASFSSMTSSGFNLSGTAPSAMPVATVTTLASLSPKTKNNSATTISQTPPPTISLRHVHSDALPPLMAQQLQQVKIASLMGLLPEAELAWMSVDDKLFVWPCDGTTTGQGATFCSFTVPNGQCVLSVGLVRPKKGVFRNSVKWCLVVTTADEAILCALVNPEELTGCDDALSHRSGALRLVPTMFSVPTDNVRMLSVCGTSDGRIFFGGEDGCLYEMTYEGPASLNDVSKGAKTVEQQLEQFYDDGMMIPATIKDETSSLINNWAVAGGKRALSAVFPGSAASEQQPRKCRKLNHSGHTPGLINAVLPEFLAKATAFIGSAKSSAKGGSIGYMAYDEERSCIYTLGSNGWICVFSLLNKGVESPAKLLSVMNTTETARLYLDAVARQRMTPPRSLAANIGVIDFPGGGSAAPKGVGGMDGARHILSLSKLGENGENVLTPISLHVVPQRESAKITLIAVTRGGLRYYISSFSGNPSNIGPLRFGERSEALASAVGSLSLCHIRAPPPLYSDERTRDMATGMTGDDVSAMDGFDAKIAKNGKLPSVDASFCGDGATVLAVQRKDTRAENGLLDSAGDHVIAMAPDLVLRKGTKNSRDAPKAPGGVSETVSVPLGLGSSLDAAPSLAGGVVAAIAQTSFPESNALTLALHSRTPTDMELSVGLVPEFVPDDRRTIFGNKESLTGVESGAIVPLRAGTLSASALKVAMSVIPNLILSRPLCNGVQFQTTNSEAIQFSKTVSPKYRISKKHGLSGFSLSAADIPANKKHISSQRKSPRLNPWLLQPYVAPLNLLTIQHLLPAKRVVLMNATGLHYFHFNSLLSAFEDALLSAGESVESDGNVTSFFKGYGYAEGFAMCAILAMGRFGSSSASSTLKVFAERAALYRVKQSTLLSDVPSNPEFVADSASASDPLVPNGYTFSPSELLLGINKVVARILRPVWNKPLVVVTEGRTVLLQWSSAKRVTPAKVEFLLDDVTLNRILEDMDAMAQLLKRWFRDFVESVPGRLTKQSHMMDMDDDDSRNLPINDAQFRNSQLFQSVNKGQLSTNEADRIARLTEQRKIHSLFRLVSRSHQLLRLFSLLVRAHQTRGLPEVEWRYVHGLTVSQLVVNPDGQDRLDRMLNDLVTHSADLSQGASTPCNDADLLAKELESQCYLLFSPGSFFCYFGLSMSRQALACEPGSAARSEFTAKAAKYFLEAAKHWHSSSIVCGTSLFTREQETLPEIVVRAALAGGSPVAKAASVLADLGEVEVLVDVCLNTAKNFRSSDTRVMVENDHRLRRKLPWEADLYHKRLPQEQLKGTNPSGSLTPRSTSRALVLGTNVTARDAITTCWSLIFYQVVAYLQRPETQGLALNMLSKCTSQNDTLFLHELFAVLRRSGHADMLLKISSTAVEEWLSQLHDFDMYYQYLMHWGRFVDAGTAAALRATDNSARTPLRKRIEYLTKARGAYSSVSERRHAGSWNQSVGLQSVEQDIIATNGLLDIAELQLRVLEELPHSSESLQEREELDGLLFPATQLFEVADTHDLFEICLLLFAACKHDDPAKIKIAWRKVLCGAIFPCSTCNEELKEFLLTFQAVYSNDPLVEFVTGDLQRRSNFFEYGAWSRKVEMAVSSLGRDVYGRGGDDVFNASWFLQELESE
jgi:nuclear pore complex protein Nup155